MNRKLKMAILPLLLGFTVSQAQDSAAKYDSIERRSYYILTDKMPIYKGGPENLKRTINKNLKWPGGGRCCIEGAVYISFIVEADGTITHRQILKGISSQTICNADGEALKVLDYLDEWMPGECKGEKVPVEIVIPVSFRLR